MVVVTEAQSYDMGTKEFDAIDINEANLILWEWETQAVISDVRFKEAIATNDISIAFEWDEVCVLQTKMPNGYNGRSRVIATESLSGEEWMQSVKDAYRDNGRQQQIEASDCDEE